MIDTPQITQSVAQHMACIHLTIPRDEIRHVMSPGIAVRWGGLAAIFAIGLFFGLVYWRSGNVWIPAVLHGLWPLNMT